MRRPSLPGRPSRRVVVGAIAIIAVALAAARLLLATPPRLGPGAAEDKQGGIGPVGDRMTFFHGALHPHGPDPVHIRSVRITGVPAGMRVVAVYGLEGGNALGAEHGDPDPNIRARLRPVQDIVLRAVPEGQPEQWSLVVVTEALAPGDWETTGIDVAWSAGRYRGTTHYDYRFGMRVAAK